MWIIYKKKKKSTCVEVQILDSFIALLLPNGSPFSFIGFNI